MLQNDLIRCMLVDDEPPALDLLRSYANMIGGLEVVAECESAVAAIEEINKQEIDLIFLDIEMPVLSGIEFLKSISVPPKIVITTAHREYAIEGYDLDVIDYLLKPISFQRFIKSVERYKERVTAQAVPRMDITSNEKEHFFVNVNKRHHKIYFQDVLYVESLKDYSRIHSKDDRLVVKGNIGSFESQLPSTHFMRIHRSFIINVNKLSSYNAVSVTIDGVVIPIGISYRKQVVAQLASLAN